MIETIYNIREFEKGIGSNGDRNGYEYRQNFLEVVPPKGVKKEGRCTSRTDLYNVFTKYLLFLSFSTGDFSIFH